MHGFGYWIFCLLVVARQGTEIPSCDSIDVGGVEVVSYIHDLGELGVN